MLLPTLIDLRRPAGKALDPEDIFGSSLGGVFTDDLQNQHGDDPEPQCGDDRSFSTTSGRLQPGFQEQIAFSGLTEPTALRFAAGGRVFVASDDGAVYGLT